MARIYLIPGLGTPYAVGCPPPKKKNEQEVNPFGGNPNRGTLISRDLLLVSFCPCFLYLDAFPLYR